MHGKIVSNQISFATNFMNMIMIKKIMVPQGHSLSNQIVYRCVTKAKKKLLI